MIRVQLFASLKDAAGESNIELSDAPQMTVEDVFVALLAKYPELGRFRSVVLAAVNEEYATWNTPVGEDDVIAFFPPVSGGKL